MVQRRARNHSRYAAGWSGDGGMSDRELRTAIQRRHRSLRTALEQRHTELITKTQARLLAQYQVEIERTNELNHRLHAITDEATRKTVAVLREFEDLADGGRWSGFGTQCSKRLASINQPSTEPSNTKPSWRGSTSKPSRR
jgi:hypothetical protein